MGRNYERPDVRVSVILRSGRVLGRPGLIDVDSGASLLFLPKDPISELLCLSKVKRAKRNRFKSISKALGHNSPHVGRIAVGVRWIPHLRHSINTKIAPHTWDWFQQPQQQQTFEIVLN